MDYESVLFLIAFGVSSLVTLNILSYISKQWSFFPEILWVLLLGMSYGAMSRFGYLNLPTLEITPDLILFFFVPLLVFASAQNICLSYFRKILLSATIAGTVGVFVSAMVFGAAFNYIFDIPWLPALLFGTIISATDPLAVGALIKDNKQISESQKLLVEGESILNDGFVVTIVGIITMILFNEHSITPFVIGEKFFIHIIGAVVIGVLAGRMARSLLKWWHEDYFILTTNMTLAIAFGSYAFSEFFGFSGILSVLSAALAYGYKPDNNVHNSKAQSNVWDYFEYLADAALFFLLGASIFSQPNFNYLSIGLGVTVILLLFLARFFSLLVVCPLLRLDKKILTPQSFWLLNFTGARGAISVALILLLPDSFEFKSLFLVLAFIMIFTSLLMYPLILKYFLHSKFFRKG